MTENRERSLWPVVVGACTLLFLQACLPLNRRATDVSDVVASKIPPLTLVGASGRYCAVDVLTYATLKPGDHVSCEWRSTNPAADSRATAATSPPTDIVKPPPPVDQQTEQRRLDRRSSVPWWQRLFFWGR